ncbi:FAD linked oxidase [Macrophomina phaseolina MS6]|uniref:FAD linked oxidase n=1 Tax=Macrophomina phaseolina (strain MS6) TaxID=1126212 RepID=K2SPC7_MACPH|nr:FAD linked oxidase [Macrophomina phaseolina MS6]
MLPASVCYDSEPDFNRTACDLLIPEWKTIQFHSDDPTSIPSPQFAGNTCNPIYANGTNLYGDTEAGKRGCHTGKYPPYVVNATEAGHVQAAVKFAKEHNLRLNVKNTGHSSLRAVAYGALSVWTHHMKSFTFHQSFAPSSCPVGNSTHMAATFGAGIQGVDASAHALDHGAVVTTGTNSDVGLLGWSAGGGHGFFTGTYGMGADNILEATVVTPSGDVVVASECENADLFWALRGGGGGTFGIVTEVTVKAFPMPSTNTIGFGMTQRNGTRAKEWWRTVAKWHRELPALKDRGVQGYYVMSGPHAGDVGALQLTGTFFLHGASNGTAQAAWEPVRKVLDLAKDVADSWVEFQHFESWADFYKTIPATGSAGGGGSARSSRLLTRHALSKDVDMLAGTLEIAGPQAKPKKGGVSNFQVSGSMIASPKPVNNSLNPAWRDTVVHYIVSNSWDDSLPKDQAKQAQDDITNVRGRALRELAPESGAYWNEADTEEPDWQHSLYGPNYSKLRDIKQRQDPDTLLWCHNCVGSEDWSEQQDGRLCRSI